MFIMLMCLLGVGLTWGIVEMVRDDDDEADTPPEDDTIRVSDLDDISTGPADDLIIGAQEHVRMVDVFAGSGNDTIQLDAEQSRIQGGPGDDLVEVSGTGNEVSGGHGNDTIVGRDFVASRYFGGAGDDVIDVDFGAGGQSGDSFVDGGAGNDELRIQIGSIAREDGAVAPVVRGGGGEDLFEIDFQPVHAPLPEGVTAEDLPPQANVALILRDFAPGTDRLVINADGGESALSLNSVELREHPGIVGGAAYTDVALIYDVPASDGVAASQQVDLIRLNGVLDLSLDDITVIERTVAAAAA